MRMGDGCSSLAPKRERRCGLSSRYLTKATIFKRIGPVQEHCLKRGPNRDDVPHCPSTAAAAWLELGMKAAYFLESRVADYASKENSAQGTH